MQPFEKHRANAAELQECGSGLLGSVGQSLATQDATRGAYKPAIAHWQGLCSPEIEAAPKPFEEKAEATRAALAWAAVTVRYWAAQVEKFNSRVDAIVAELESYGPTYGARGSDGDPPTDAQVADARQAAEAEAKRKWWQAHETHIVEGQERAASMLKEGPTQQNVAAAMDAGALDKPKDFSDYMWDGLKGNVIPPDHELAAIATAGWGAGLALNTAGHAATYMTHGRVGRFAPRNAMGRFTSARGMSWTQRGLAGARSTNWVALPHRSQAYARWSNVGKWAGRAGTVLTVGTSAFDQWIADSGRSDLSTTERTGRVATRAATVGAGAWAGGKGGFVVGAAIGTAIAPGVGTVIGGVVGGVIGGVVGSAAGNWVADRFVDDIGEQVGKIGDSVGKLGSALNPFD